MNSGALLRWLAVSCAINLSGCAYFSPYIPLKKEGSQFTPNPRQPMPQTKSAIAKIDSWIDDAQNRRTWTDVPRRSLNLLTFGLLAGLGVRAMHGHHVNSVKNLALAAGASYTGTTLFLPITQVSSYTKTEHALTCIRERGASLEGSVVLGQGLIHEDEVDRTKQQLRPQGCAIQDAELQRAFDDAQSSLDALRSAIRQAQIADLSVATKLESASRNVLQALATQIEAQDFSGEALLGAAKSMAAIAVGVVPAPLKIPAAAAVADRDGGPPPCQLTPERITELKKRLADLKSTYDRLKETLAQQVNAVAGLDTACTLMPQKIDPVALSQTQLNVTKDTNVNISIAGGVEPFKVEPVETGADIEVQHFPPRTINVRGTANTKAGKTYTYKVTDRSAVTTPVTLTLSTK